MINIAHMNSIKYSNENFYLSFEIRLRKRVLKLHSLKETLKLYCKANLEYENHKVEKNLQYSHGIFEIFTIITYINSVFFAKEK